MPNLSKLRTLSEREQAIVAIAVLLDGHDAENFLTSDKNRGQALSRAAGDLVQLSPDLRIPLLGTLLRRLLIKLH